MKKYFVLLVLILIQGCSSGGDDAPPVDPPPVVPPVVPTPAELVGTWVADTCLPFTQAGPSVRFKLIFRDDSTMDFSGDSYGSADCSGPLIVPSIIADESNTIVIGNAVTTGSGLDAIEIDYTNDVTGDVNYSIYSIDANDHLFTGNEIPNDGSTEALRRSELNTDFFVRQ